MIAALASADSKALAHFLAHVHPDGNVAFVVSEPLPASVELRAPVVIVDRSIALVPGCVHVPAREMALSIRDGVLEPQKPQPDGLAFLLRSLARDQKERAIAILLGTEPPSVRLGVEEVSANGGLVFCTDDPGEATPEVGCEVAEQILRKLGAGGSASPDRDVSSECTARITATLSEHRPHAFSTYKQAFVERRMFERMCARGVRSIAGYGEMLDGDALECELFFRQLLIGVTEFFREQTALNALQEKVIPELLERKGPLRIWVPACSTGEEAYSIAILLIEALERATSRRQFKVFGTDLDSRAIDRARKGCYSPAILDKVGAERISRFFRREGSHFVVGEALRRSVSFSLHDLMTDPPFLSIDLLSCRNLLIYLEPWAQREAIATFHRSLVEGGILLLGESETISGAGSSFEPVDYHARIYRKARCSSSAR